MNFDVDYFIDKFQRIPEENWTIGHFARSSFLGKTQHCAYGHCGYTRALNTTPEGDALWIVTNGRAMSINDGLDEGYKQRTPKQRILAALRDIKAKQEAEKPKADVIVGGPEVETPKPKERIVYVTVDSAVRELQQTIGEN